MLGFALLEHIEKMRRGVNARRKKHYFGFNRALPDEIKNLRRGEIGLALELRRQETVEACVIQRLFEQEVANGPVLVPVGSFVCQVVEDGKARIEVAARYLRRENLEDVRIGHAKTSLFETAQSYAKAVRAMVVQCGMPELSKRPRRSTARRLCTLIVTACASN